MTDETKNYMDVLRETTQIAVQAVKLRDTLMFRALFSFNRNLGTKLISDPLENAFQAMKIKGEENALLGRDIANHYNAKTIKIDPFLQEQLKQANDELSGLIVDCMQLLLPCIPEQNKKVHSEVGEIFRKLNKPLPPQQGAKINATAGALTHGVGGSSQIFFWSYFTHSF
jgi:hypothetical protein